MTPRQRVIQMIDLVSSPFSDQVNVTPEPWLASFKIWDPARRKHPPPTTKHHVQVPSSASPHLMWDRIYMLGYPTRHAHQLFGNIQTGGWIKPVLCHLYVRHPVSGSHMAAQKIESFVPNTNS